MTLLDLERVRKQIFSNYKLYQLEAIGVGLFVAGSVILGLYIGDEGFYNENRYLARIIFFFLFIFIFFMTYKATIKVIITKKSTKFKKQFKEFYLVDYFKELGFNYNMNSHMDAVDMIRSELFLSFDTQRGNDQIKGYKNGVLFSFSDIVLYDIEEEEQDFFDYVMDKFSKNSSDKKNYVKLFEGLFFMADFNKTITSKTFVMQNGTPRIMSGLSVINMDNPLFNTKFKIYSDDIQNAMYILSPALMERINSLSLIIKSPINISFIGNKIYISINVGKDSFEPDVTQSLVTKNPIHTIKRQLEAVLGIVEVLALDSNLWAKVR